MNEMIKVGMADLDVCLPPYKLTTLGLGSCVGISLHDPIIKVAGMAHIMLPDSTQIRNNSNKAKFADTGIDTLIDNMVRLGANRRRIVAKIAGGAQMFEFSSNNDMLRIGERNIVATKEKLFELNIPILAEDTGANYGRTIIFDPENGYLHVKAIGKDSRIL